MIFREYSIGPFYDQREKAIYEDMTSALDSETSNVFDHTEHLIVYFTGWSEDPLLDVIDTVILRVPQLREIE
jgi:hypothetical protein